MAERPKRQPRRRSRRPPSPGCRSTSAACSRSPTPARRRSRRSASPSWPGVNAAKVRKDLSYLGSYGTRGVGYDVEYLLFQMSRELGLTHDWPVVIVGLGNLGHALANYGGFRDRGFPVAALVDADPAKVVGTEIGGITSATSTTCPQVAAEPPGNHRDHRHPGLGGPGRRRPAGRRRRHVDPQLRPDRPVGARRPCRSGRSTWPSSCRSSASTSSAAGPERAPRPAGRGVRRRGRRHRRPAGGSEAAWPTAPQLGQRAAAWRPSVEATLYPVNLIVAGRPVLVVGGGRVAARRCGAC